MNGAALLALQLLDSELDAIGGRRRRLPERATLDAARAEQAVIAAERARLESEVRAAEAEIERAEHDGSELDTKRRRLEAQLKTVIAPREAEALMSEIATLTARRGEVDDVELDAMERQAGAEAALAMLAEREPAAAAAVDVAGAALAEADAALADQAAVVTGRRAEAAAALSADDLATYTALRARHGGVAIARIERRTCGGCHVDLSPMEYDQVKSTPDGEIAECPNCNRFVVV